MFALIDRIGDHWRIVGLYETREDAEGAMSSFASLCPGIPRKVIKFATVCDEN